MVKRWCMRLQLDVETSLALRMHRSRQNQDGAKLLNYAMHIACAQLSPCSSPDM